MRRSGFTLVEIMIVVLILGILLTIAVPNWMKAREGARAKSCLENLRSIEGAKEQWAMENRKGSGDAVVRGRRDPDHRDEARPVGRSRRPRRVAAQGPFVLSGYLHDPVVQRPQALDDGVSRVISGDV